MTSVDIPKPSKAPTLTLGFLLLITVLVISSGVSIVVITLDLLSKTSEFTEPEQSRYAITSMVTLFLCILPSHYIAQKIHIQNAIIMGFVMGAIGLILLSLANIVSFGSALLIFSLSLLFLNLLCLYARIAATHYQHLEIPLLWFYISIITGYFLGIFLQNSTTDVLGDANSYLIAGMINVLGLFIFIFVNHFLLTPYLSDQKPASQPIPQIITRVFWVSVGTLLATILLVQYYHLCIILGVVALFITAGNRVRMAMKRNAHPQVKIYLSFFLIIALLWPLIGVGNFLFNNIQAEKFWGYAFQQWFSLNTYPIEILSQLGKLVCLLVILPIFFHYLHHKKSVGAFRLLCIACLCIGLGNFTLWLPLQVYPDLSTHSDGLSFGWVLPFQIFSLLGHALTFITGFNFVAKAFYKSYENMLSRLTELTLIGAFSWSLVAIIVSSISWNITQSLIGEWRVIYPTVSGYIAILSFILAGVCFIFDRYYQSRYKDTANVVW